MNQEGERISNDRKRARDGRTHLKTTLEACHYYLAELQQSQYELHLAGKREVETSRILHCNTTTIKKLREENEELEKKLEEAKETLAGNEVRESEDYKTILDLRNELDEKSSQLKAREKTNNEDYAENNRLKDKVRGLREYNDTLKKERDDAIDKLEEVGAEWSKWRRSVNSTIASLRARLGAQTRKANKKRRKK